MPVFSRYYYKFIVNGQWRHSTSSPAERDDSGNVNNVIVIGDTASVRPSVQQQQKVSASYVYLFPHLVSFNIDLNEYMTLLTCFLFQLTDSYWTTLDAFSFYKNSSHNLIDTFTSASLLKRLKQKELLHI